MNLQDVACNPGAIFEPFFSARFVPQSDESGPRGRQITAG
jgi:hypothetical protein